MLRRLALFLAATAFAAGATFAQTGSANTGKVLQVQNGGGYTYAEVQTVNGMKVWIAGQQIDVRPGASVTWGNFMIMQNFQAKSINRNFPEILFVEQWAPAGQAPVATAPHGKLPEPRLATAAADAGANGVVKSIANSGGYSYVEVQRGNGVIWVAGPQANVKKGDKVQWAGASEMSNFTAKSLGRTFDKILFVQSLSAAK